MSILHLVEIQILDKQLCMVIQYSFSFIEDLIIRHSHIQAVIHKKYTIGKFTITGNIFMPPLQSPSQHGNLAQLNNFQSPEVKRKLPIQFFLLLLQYYMPQHSL